MLFKSVLKLVFPIFRFKQLISWLLQLKISSVQFSCSIVSDSLWSHGLQPARLPCPSAVPSSVQFSHSVRSDSLRPHEPQHARPPCPSPTPRVYSNTCPLCRWCHATISSSVVPFSSHLQFFPASGSFQMSQLFTSGGQSTRVSASHHKSFQGIFRADLL